MIRHATAADARVLKSGASVTRSFRVPSHDRSAIREIHKEHRSFEGAGVRRSDASGHGHDAIRIIDMGYRQPGYSLLNMIGYLAGADFIGLGQKHDKFLPAIAGR